MGTKKKKKQYTPIGLTARMIELGLNILLLLLYGTALISPYVSPMVTQVPAFLNLAFAVILVLLLVVWIAYLIIKRWKYFALYSFVLLLSSGYILTYIPIHFGKGLKTERDLRVMTYNVRGFLSENENKERLAALLINESDADIVAIQECNVYPDRKGNNRRLKALTKKYPFRHVYPGKTLAVISKYPILYTEAIEYPSVSNGSYAYLIELPDDKKLLLVNNHMESYSLHFNEKERYKDYLREFSLKQLPQQALEIKRRLGPQLNQRAYAAERVQVEVRKLIEKYEPDCTIVLGDLNDTPMSYTYWQLRNGMKDAYARTGLGLGVSFNDKYLPFRIDHIFYEGGLKAIGGKIPSYPEHSDHNPLIADFKIIK